MNTLLLLGLWGILGGKPKPTPTPPASEMAIVTPNPNSKIEFCRQVVNSIPEVCDAPDAELGGCLTVVDKICPNRNRK